MFENNLRLIGLIDQQRTAFLGITGRQPTLLNQDLVKIIEECRLNLPNALLALLTNGRKLNMLNFTKALVAAGHPCPRVGVALYDDNDTEPDSIVCVPGSFYETIQGLHNLALLRLPVGLRTVLHALTLGRLPQYAEFVCRNLSFVTQVAFMGMETAGMALENLDRLWVDPLDYNAQLSEAVRHLVRRSVPVAIYNHQLCVLPRELWPFARRSISSWKEMSLPECKGCFVKNICYGFFGTGFRHTSHVQPFPEHEVRTLVPPAVAESVNEANLRS